MFGVASLALYASALNHVFGQMLGLPGSCVLLPYVPFYRLTRHQENYCDCAPVQLGEHLSRERRKLTVMIWCETGQPLDDSPESVGFLRIKEGPFPPGTYVPRIRASAVTTRGYLNSPILKILWLSESVKAL